MTAPDSQRNRAKSAQILAAARHLFLEQGYGRTSTDAITQAAGVSKQTLYAYFPGKAELLVAVMARELAGLAVIGDTATAPETLADFRGNLLAFARALTTHLLRAESLALLRLMIGEALHLPELRALVRQAILAHLLVVAESLLVEAQSKGIVRVSTPNLSARMLVGPLMSFVVFDGLLGESLPDPPSEATLTQLIDLFLLTLTPGGTTP